MKYLRRFDKTTVNRTTKIIIGGASAIGATTGMACAYIYYIIETVVTSK